MSRPSALQVICVFRHVELYGVMGTAREHKYYLRTFEDAQSLLISTRNICSLYFISLVTEPRFLIGFVEGGFISDIMLYLLYFYTKRVTMVLGLKLSNLYVLVFALAGGIFS
ncbi:hypothetical protein BDN67DRAFT_966419 [Paxillus ammoniavirescens]|nr:hypothetical protein BDN67DRAFT_966419 [Paxillus ammoniavirescens]